MERAMSMCVGLPFSCDLRGSLSYVALKELGQSKVVLDDGKLHGGITRDGTFDMCVRPSRQVASANLACSPDVPPGTYLLSVLSHDFHFDKVCASFESIWLRLAECP